MDWHWCLTSSIPRGLKIPQAQAAPNTNIQKFLLLLAPSNFVLYTYDLLIYFFFSPPSQSSVVSVTLTFTARCHSFSLSLLCHEADVTDQCARQLCLMCKAPRYKGKRGVQPVLGSACFTPAAASCHAPSCFTSPNAQGVLPSWDLTLRGYAHRAIKKMSGQQLIYNMFRLGTPCGTVKAGSKGESKKKYCAKAIVDFTFCL